MRQIVLDTETTGLEPGQGDRVIEVAAVELVNLLPTGATFHRLVDPERDIPAEATRVHGFTNGDLAGKPKFAEIADEMLAFLGDTPIRVIIKLLILSVAVGFLMSIFGLYPQDILFAVRNFVLDLWNTGFKTLGRLGDYLLLGAVIVIPVFIVIRLLSYRR